MDEFCWSRLLVLSCPFIWFWQVFLRSSLTLVLLLLGILQYSLRFCTTCFYVFVVTASSNNRLDDASGDRSQNQAAAFRFLSSQVTESSVQLIVVLYNKPGSGAAKGGSCFGGRGGTIFRHFFVSFFRSILWWFWLPRWSQNATNIGEQSCPRGHLKPT